MKKYLKIIIPIVIAVVAVVGIIIGVNAVRENSKNYFPTLEARQKHIEQDYPSSQIVTETEVDGYIFSAFENESENSYGLAVFYSDGKHSESMQCPPDSKLSYAVINIEINGRNYRAIWNNDRNIARAVISTKDRQGNEASHNEYSMLNREIIIFEFPRNSTFNAAFYDIEGNDITPESSLYIQ